MDGNEVSSFYLKLIAGKILHWGKLIYPVNFRTTDNYLLERFS